MAIISAALDAPPDSFDLLGAPSQSSVVLRNAAVVTPAGESAVTIPAGTFAVTETAPSTAAVWDRASAVMVLYAKPGDTHLYAIAEGDLASVGTAAPLARVLRHAVVLSPALSGAGGGAILGSGLEFAIDGGGVAITTGTAGSLLIPFNCTITSVQLLADQVGSIVVDIWKNTYSSYPGSSADSITAAAKPTLSSAQKYQDTTLAGWTTAVSPGDILTFNVNSASTLTRCNVVLDYTRPAETNALELLLDGGGSTLATGVGGDLAVPWDCTITSCTLLADQSGSLVLDLLRSSYAGYPTGTSIVASAPPTISAAQKSQDSSLTGWTKTLSAGDVIAVSVTSVTSIQRCVLALAITRTDAGSKAAPAVGALAVDHGGTLVGTRPTLNFIDGTGATLTVADNAGTDSVDVTVAASGGGGTTPAVKAYSNALDGTSIGAGAQLTLGLELTQFDQGTGTAQHDNVTNNSRLTCQVSGLYQVSAFVGLNCTAASAAIIAVNRANGGVWQEYVFEQRGYTAASGSLFIEGSNLVQLTAGDYLYLDVNNTGSAAFTIQAPGGSTGNHYPSLSMVMVQASAAGAGAVPAAKAYTAVSQNTNAGPVAFELTAYDQGTATAQHDNVTNNSRLTCQEAGLYRVSATAAMQIANTLNTETGTWYMYIAWSNAGGTLGERVAQQEVRYLDPSTLTSWTTRATATADIKMAVGDYVFLVVSTYDGTNSIAMRSSGSADVNDTPVSLSLAKIG